MKKIIRNIVLTIAFLLVLIVILTAIQNYFQSAYYFPRSYMNKNTDLGDFDFYMRREEFKDKVENNPNDFENTMTEDGYSKYDSVRMMEIFFNANVISENPKVSSIKIENPKLDVFGLNVGDSLSSIGELLSSKGFKYRGDVYTNGLYLKGDIRISFNLDVYDEDHIVNIYIGIDDEEMWD